MDKKLLLKLMNGESKRSPEFDDKMCKGTKVKVFTAEGDNLICKFWNGSNDDAFPRAKACNHIAEAYIEDESVGEGHFTIDFNEIWFEITEK